jgi:hypothetical protein
MCVRSARCWSRRRSGLPSGSSSGPFFVVLFDDGHPRDSFYDVPCCTGFVRSYDISWNGVAGNLLSLSINFVGTIDVFAPQDSVLLD